MTKISIIIPAKNAGASFKETLAAIFRQTGVPPFEVIVIDSGSTDGTLQVCRQFPVSLVQIAPERFGHGSTRNYGASLARGEVLVFLVQDALPQGMDWLANLLMPLQQDQRIAGAYSRNIPRERASQRQAREIRHYFGPEQRLQDSPADHIFSNVSSAIKKEVLDLIPFPEVEFGEDQLWAKQVLEAGHLIQYAPASVVVHSHHYGFKEAYRRGRQEGSFVKAIGQKTWHASYVTILLEMLFETAKWALRGDAASCRYSMTMAAWHCGFRKGFAAKR